MAKVDSGVLIVAYDEGALDRASLPVASATVIRKGDLISLESNKAVLLDDATEDATFAGISESESASGETDDITVLRRCIVEITVGSATYDYGNGLKYNAGDADNAYDFVADAGADTIMWIHKQYDVAATIVLALVDIVALRKLFGVDA